MAVRNAIGVVLCLILSSPAVAAPDRTSSVRALAGTSGQVAVSRATGVIRFVRFERPLLASAVAKDAAPESQAIAFLTAYRDAFGLTDPARELRLLETRREASGATHLAYTQVHRGIPVFATRLRVHFDAQGRMTVINGTVIPDLRVDTVPAIPEAEAGRRATRLNSDPEPERRMKVASDDAQSSAMTEAVRPSAGIIASRLVIFRAGLVRGTQGTNHLAWEVRVQRGSSELEAAYVDAHTGRVIDRIPLSMEALDRRAFDGFPNFPGTPFWEENDAFPTADTDGNDTIDFTSDTWNFFNNSFGRDSFDGAGARMDAVFHYVSASDCYSGYARVSPSRHVLFCYGIPGDDFVGHEWTHHYTDLTDGLIYQWQPGAINEAYSDIFGETIDLINGKGQDAPNAVRTTDLCSLYYTRRETEVAVTSPSAATYPARMAGSWGDPFDETGISGNAVLVDDGSGTTSDGCETPFVNAAAILNKIAIIDRGGCVFAQKAQNAAAAGASALIIVNSLAGGDTLFSLFTDDTDLARSLSIPTVLLGYTNGTALKALLPASVTVAATGPSEDSRRWLFGEDSPGWGGFLRDMWSPTCGGDPGKVTDAQYWCDTGDFGGVHHNSGIVNHTYALLTDGGTFNVQTVTGIGLTKAAHIYWRAKETYQVPVTDFHDHADALEQACQDLIGVNLAGLTTGAASGQIITAGNCGELSKAIAATELRTQPAQCAFATLLDQDPPTHCGVGDSATLFVEDFESGFDGWTAANAGVNGTWTARNWHVSSSLPMQRSGSAALAPNSSRFGDCVYGTAPEAGEMTMDSPAIVLPAGSYVPMLSFLHSMATETGWNGGNVKINVNNGGWQAIGSAAFVYNAYHATLAAGSNPNNGEQVFTGTDEGSLAGAWGESIVDLSSFASPGDTIRLRFEFGVGACFLSQGWHVDDIRVFSCNRISVGTFTNSGAASAGATTVSVITSEPGTSTTFGVVLQSQPTGLVQIPVASSDLTEGTVSPPVLEFDSSDWAKPKTVTVTGVDDSLVDGTVPYTITLGPAVSTDTAYSGQSPAAVQASNQDDDIPPIPAATPLVLMLLAAMLAVAGAFALRSS